MTRHAVIHLGLMVLVMAGIPLASVDGIRAADQPLSSEVLMADDPSGLPSQATPVFCPDAIVVKFDPNTPDAECRRILATHLCWIVASCPVADVHLVGIPPDASPLQMVVAFTQYASVRYAELNYYVQATFIPDDKLYSYQWNLNNATQADIRMQDAWDIEEGDPNVIVAVIDTGVAYEDYDIYRRAPDLANTRFVPGYDFVHDDSHPNDDHGHGTHVAGTIAQSTNNGIGVAGIAFRCSIMPIKAVDEQGIGDQFTIARAVLYAATHGAHVINLSLGSSQSSITLRNAVRTAYERGVTVVAAAGNDFTRGNLPSYPAADKEYCIGVGAVRFDLRRAPYSNTGAHVAVVAPGGDLTVDQNADGYPDGILQQTFKTDPNSFAYWFFQGTSMATPHVSGLTALLVSRGVTRPDKVREAIQLTARNLGRPGWDPEYGWGLIDARAALAYRVPGDRNGDNVVDAADLVPDATVVP